MQWLHRRLHRSVTDRRRRSGLSNRSRITPAIISDLKWPTAGCGGAEGRYLPSWMAVMMPNTSDASNVTSARSRGLTRETSTAGWTLQPRDASGHSGAAEQRVAVLLRVCRGDDTRGDEAAVADRVRHELLENR